MVEVSSQELRRLYAEEGRSLVELGALYERAPATVWGWLKSHGIKVRSRSEAARNRSNAITEDEGRRMLVLYEQGKSSNDIAKELGRDGRLIRTHLKQMGVLRSRTEAVRLAAEQGKIASAKADVRFFEEMTPVSAWVLGLIFGDGHVSRANNQITLAGTEQVCRAVADHIGHNAGPTPDKTNCWLLKWSSWRTADFLENTYGVRGNKATKMKFPHIFEGMLPHFVRGLWDADGGWRRKGFYLRANYACSSIEFIQGLVHVLEFHGWQPRLRKHVTPLNGKKFVGYRIELLADHSRELAEWLYQDSVPMIRCERKWQIALQGGNRKFKSDHPETGVIS